MQVLEGKKAIIEALYERIEQDPRHTDVTKLVDCPVKERSFAEWSMGCKATTTHQLDLIKTVVDLGQADWLAAKPDTNMIVNMLKSVYKSDLYNRQPVATATTPTLLHQHIQEWKQHYRQLAQMIQALDEEEPTARFNQPGELNPVSSEVDKAQRMEALVSLFESNRMLIWKRQQKELSQQYSLA